MNTSLKSTYKLYTEKNANLRRKPELGVFCFVFQMIITSSIA